MLGADSATEAWKLFLTRLSGYGTSAASLVPLVDALKSWRRLVLYANYHALVALWQQSPGMVKESNLRDIAEMVWDSLRIGMRG